MILSYLALLLVTLCAIYPLSSMVMGSPRPAQPSDNLFLSWVARSGLVALAVAITGLALSSAIGYAVSRSSFLRRTSTLTRALLAQMAPVALFLLALLAASFWLGLIASYLVLIIIYALSALPFCIWQMKRYYDTIPLALEEAAEIEGASSWQRFWHVMRPLARPALAITAFFSLLIAWNEYVIAAIVMGQPKIFPEPAGVPIISLPVGLYCTAGLLVAIPALLLFVLVSRLVVSRFSGSVSQ